MSLQGNFGAQQGTFPAVPQLSGLSREGWNQLVASATGPGVSAAHAAVDLDPFYRAQRENRGRSNGQNSRRTGDWQERGERRRGRSGSLGGFGMQGDQGLRQIAQQYSQSNGFQQTFGPRGHSSGGSGNFPLQNTVMTPQQLGATWENGQIRGLDREGYQGLLSQYGAANGYNGTQGGRYNGYNGAQGTWGGRTSGNGGYINVSERPSQSFRGGTPAKSTDVAMNNAESAAIAMLQAASSPGRITNRSDQNFNEVDIARIAQALGIPTEGLTRASMIAAIKAQTGGLSPRSQTQALGSQSPRTQQFLGSLASRPLF